MPLLVRPPEDALRQAQGLPLAVLQRPGVLHLQGAGALRPGPPEERGRPPPPPRRRLPHGRRRDQAPRHRRRARPCRLPGRGEPHRVVGPRVPDAARGHGAPAEHVPDLRRRRAQQAPIRGRGRHARRLEVGRGGGPREGQGPHVHGLGRYAHGADARRGRRHGRGLRALHAHACAGHEADEPGVPGAERRLPLHPGPPRARARGPLPLRRGPLRLRGAQRERLL
mmetsp:Transcript_66437/g.185692  ORF Transcript_66437/g.185692 Transcript_66437/m.185692 type:complete len:225 (-) Transcript_66437:464-1138(-)